MEALNIYIPGLITNPRDAICLEKDFPLYGINKCIDFDYNNWINDENFIEKTEKEYGKITTGFDCVNITAHSTGGNIALYLTSRFENIKKLVLLAPAPVNLWKVIVNKLAKLALTSKDTDDYTFKERLIRTRDFLSHCTLKTLEVFPQTVKLAEASLKNCKCPTAIFHGTSDTVVPIESSEFVYNNLGSDWKELITIENTGHRIIHSNHKAQILKEMAEFFGADINATHISKEKVIK